MGVGLSGMISGLDTDAIVKAMVSGQQAKATKVENKITLNKWTKEAWSGLNTKIYSFYTKYASKLRLQTSYMTRTASSSNESVAKATAGSGAAVGTHSLQVKALASSQYVTGAQLKDEDGKKADYNKNSKLTEQLGVEAGTIFTITGQLGSEKEETVKLEVTKETTINDFLNACKDAGLTASFDTGQQRFFISSSDSGSENKFSITANKYSNNVLSQLEGIEDMVDTSYLSTTDKEKYEEAIATLRENAEVISEVLNNSTNSEYVSTNKAYTAVKDAIETVKTMAEKTYADQEANDQELEKVLQLVRDGIDIEYGTFKSTRADLKTKAKNNIDAPLKSSANKIAIENLGNLEELQTALNGAETDDIKYSAVKDLTFEKYDKATQLIETYENGTDEEKAKITEEQFENAKAIVNTWEYVTEDGKTIGSRYEEAFEAQKVSTYGDSYNATIRKEMRDIIIEGDKEHYNKQVAEIKKDILSEDKKEEYNEFIDDLKKEIEVKLTSAVSGLTTTESTTIDKMGLGQITGGEQSVEGGMVVVGASDAVFVLDGAEMTEKSNSFTVNGLTLNLSSTTERKDSTTTGTTDPDKKEYDTIQITVGKDVDSTYKLVKEAITEYNKLLEEMNTLYNADSARGYDPLTDEQKEAMSETDIENWEKKIKDSLLRRDDTLGTLLSSMRNALSTSYKDEDGKTYSLSTYGIVTGNYTEKGKLHIYGDEDDGTYATYDDRLKAALDEDPDKVMETLTHIFGNLYSTMTEKCAKTEISSALTFYNDKQYNNLLKDYEDDLDILEDRIKELEDRYYKQFTAMEKAMSTLQNQSNSLASLLGTGA